MRRSLPSLPRVSHVSLGPTPGHRCDVAPGAFLPVSLFLHQALARPVAGTPGSQWMFSQLDCPLYHVLISQA